MLHFDGRGHTGAIVTLGGNHIFSYSSKQKIQARSSTEAELIALDDITTYVVWMRQLMVDLGIEMEDNPTIIYQDNKSGVEILEGGGNFRRTKHMVGRYAYVKENLDRKIIRLEYRNTKKMTANMHTKPVNRDELEMHCKSFNLFL